MSAQSYPKIRLGEAVERVTKGTTPTTHGYPYTDGGVCFLRVENLQNGVVDTSKVKTFISPEADRFLKRSSLEVGDVLISIAGTIGRTAIVREHDVPANTNQAVAIIRGAAKRFEPVFLRLVLESPLLHRHITGEARGGAMQNISLENVRNVIVPVPPLPEQRRIVAEIEKQFTRMEAGVAALRRVQANLKRYRAAVLKAACEGRLVPTEAELQRNRLTTEGTEKHRGKKAKPLCSSVSSVVEDSGFESGQQLLARILTERRQNWQGRGKYKEPDSADAEGLSILPEGWAWANGEQMFSWSSGEGLTQKDIQAGNYPVYGGNGVNGYHNAFVSEIPTLVIGRVGALCGNVYLTDGPAWITDNAIYAIQTPSCVAMRFIRLAFTRAQLNKRAAGSGQPFVNQRMLNETIIPLPPLAEQTRIVAEVERRLSVVEELEAVVTTNLQRATRLRQSILQKAFTGELFEAGEIPFKT